MSAPGRRRLAGPDAANPLGFLAALGALRSLALAVGEGEPAPRLAWERYGGAWRPVLELAGGVAELEEPALAELLAGWLRGQAAHPAFGLGGGKNLTLTKGEFHAAATEAARAATPADRSYADFLAAFGTDVLELRGSIRDTALRTMSGAGHQHFLATMRHLLETVEPGHVKKALFAPWRWDDPPKNLSLRWDPHDDARYALRWTDPSKSSERRSGSVLGANALAVQALPLFPTAVVRGRLATVGFSRGPGGEHRWTWPVWEEALPLDVVGTALALPELVEERPLRERLASRGVVEVYRSRRITVGRFRNFTPGRPA